MDDFISRSRAISTVAEKPDMTEDEKTAIIRRLLAIPAADVVEVVRCKDCIHRPIRKEPTLTVKAPLDADGWPDETCPYLCEDSWYNTMPQDDWFFRLGERKGAEM